MTKAELQDALMRFEHELDVARAQLGIALDVIAGLIATHDDKEFGFTNAQQAWRRALAVLVEHGRSVER